ncbi:MAG: hypothetical protein NNA20_10710 [Nitrospira sp.]|nr:hypothetical protein [Nitrospira sp.]
MSHIERWLLACLPTSWQDRLRATHEANKSIVRSMFWLVLFVLAAKGIATLKEVAVAYRYGTSEVLEGYLLVFNLAIWPVSLAFSVMNFALVPTLVRLAAGDPAASHQWQRQVTTWVWLLAIGLMAVVALGLPIPLERGWLGLTAAGRAAAMDVLPAMAVITGLGIIASWHACQLMSRQRHFNTFLEAMPALGILMFVLLLPAEGASPLLWGTVVGFAVQATLIAHAVRAVGLPLALAWPPGKPFQPDLSGRTAWLLTAQLWLTFSTVIDQIVLAHLSAGSLAAYGYASRVLAIVLSLGDTVLGRALLPVLSTTKVDGDGLVLTRRWSIRAFWAGALCAGLLLLVSDSLVRLIFERGAFVAEDSHITSWLLVLLTLQVPPYFAGIVWYQWAVACINDARSLWQVAIAATVSKFTIMALLVWLQLGASAVALAHVCMIVVWWSLTYACCRKT